MSFNQYMCGSVDVILFFDYLFLWEKQKHAEGIQMCQILQQLW